MRLVLGDVGLILSVWNSGVLVSTSFDAQQQASIGLRLVWDLTAVQYGGHFTIRPDGEGRAEAFFPQSGLAQDAGRDGGSCRCGEGRGLAC